MGKYVTIPIADGKFTISKEALDCTKTICLLLIFLVISVSFYVWYEGWTISSSITFIIVTMSTVGYGYDAPSDDHSRLFTIFVMIFGVFGVYSAINQVVETRLAELNKEARKVEKDMTSAEMYRQHHKRLMLNVFLILASLFIAAGVFSLIEDMTFAKGLYFAVQTACTVGFGDIPLKRLQSRQFLGFYIMFSTILMTFAFNNFRNLSADYERVKEAAQFAKRKKTLARIKELDTGNGVPMDTFLLAVLEQLGVLDRERDLEPWIKKFKEIDADNSGSIDADEIEAFSAQERTLAEQQLRQMKRAARRDSSFLNSRFSNSFTSTLALGFTGDPLDSSEGDEEDSDAYGNGNGYGDGYDDTHSVTSSSSSGAGAGAEGGRGGDHGGDGTHHGNAHATPGLFMRAGDWQYWLFGGGAQRDHHHGLHQHHHSAGAVHHHHHGDLAPPDMERKLLSLSADDIEAQERQELELQEARESLCLNDLSRPQSSASMTDDMV